MATILISGGTGMIGTRLTQLLSNKGYDVIILTRSSANVRPMPILHAVQNGVSYANWDIDKQTIDKEAIAKTDHIIHLAGAGVADKRWSIKRKQEIVNSRIKSSSLLVKALQEIPNKVATVVSSSAIGWYGTDTTKSKLDGFSEEEPADKEFLGEACRLWEHSIDPVEKLGKRLVKLRTGIVLSNEGGALAEFKKPLKLGIAAILGGGQQVISWIHVDDLCQMFIHAIENTDLRGVYNAVAPNPVSNKYLTITLAKKLRGNYFIAIHIPAFLLKIIMGEMSIEVLKSVTVKSIKIEASGFHFRYPTIETALLQLGKPNSS